jgi:acetylornithine deacetylase/succinyl-diaminopimelate desuccinylase-like protein
MNFPLIIALTLNTAFSANGISFLPCNNTPEFQTAVNSSKQEKSSYTDYRKLGKEIFKELIEINTTSKYGSTKAAEAMASRLRSAGFPDSDIQVIGPDQQHKNLVFRYHGTGKQKPVLFICHLDVVEALRADWSVDPFTFLEEEGFFYGRGTTDIKNEDASLITNVIRLKNEGYVPDRDIIIALTADEETGNANGVEWLIKNHKELIDAEFCINPDGGGGDSRNGQNITMAIQTSEKIYMTFRLEVKIKGGHSSLPVKDNAIYTLAAGLTRLQAWDFPVQLNETTRNFFEKVANSEKGQVKSDILTILMNPHDTASARRLASYSAYYNAMMRTTCVATMMSAGHAENALPQTALAIVNCRMLPSDNPENVLKTLKDVIADNRISVTCPYSSFSAPLSPLRDDITGPVTQIAASMWPGVNVTPIMSTGATDGKYLRVKGIPVYGVSGMFGDMDDVRAHGKDERIEAKDFYDGIEFMYRFMKALSSEKIK